MEAGLAGRMSGNMGRCRLDKVTLLFNFSWKLTGFPHGSFFCRACQSDAWMFAQPQTETETPRTRRRRRHVSGRPERKAAGASDSERLPNTAEPRHCKGISTLCFLKQFGIKEWEGEVGWGGGALCESVFAGMH